MSETKTPETGCAPLGRPLAEAVSLEAVWAAAYAAAYVREELNTRGAVKIADDAVADLLAAHPRGGR
jgi:hypothetical protein